MSISNYLENAILDKVLRNTDFSVATGSYLSLHTADPGKTGADEVTGGSYARQAIAFDAAVTGSAGSSASESFTGMPACTVTHVGLWDTVTVGSFLWSGALSASKVVNSGDTFQFAAGDVIVTLD